MPINPRGLPQSTALPLHIERVTLAFTSITAVGQRLIGNGVGSDRALPWTCAAPCKGVKGFPCFSAWVGEVGLLYRFNPSFSTFSIKARCELLRLEVGIYTTLSQEECIVALVAFTVPSGNVLPTTSTRDRLPCGRMQQLTEGRVRCVQVGGVVWEGVSSWLGQVGKMLPTRFSEVPPQHRFSGNALDRVYWLYKFWSRGCRWFWLKKTARSKLMWLN